jgi:hypothetical protein
MGRPAGEPLSFCCPRHASRRAVRRAASRTDTSQAGCPLAQDALKQPLEAKAERVTHIRHQAVRDDRLPADIGVNAWRRPGDDANDEESEWCYRSLMRGYYFTERVRRTLDFAREDAARFHHAYVGTEHMLLGLLRVGDTVAATMLENLHVPLDELRDRLESSLEPGTSEPTGPHLPYASHAKKVLELAMDEARGFSHSYVGTEHLLISVLRHGRGVAGA